MILVKKFLLFSLIPSCVFGAAIFVAQSHVANGANAAIAAPGQPLQVISAVSRKTHGAAGDFDIDLPLNAPFGIESRGVSGNHTIVVTFSNTLTSGSAFVADGAGNVAATVVSGKTMTINLIGVPDARVINLSLMNVVDAFAQSLPDTTITMQTLLGDATGDGAVTVADISFAKSQLGQPVTASNFRADINASGDINASVITTVKRHSGTFLPGARTGRKMASGETVDTNTQLLSFSGPTTIDLTTTTQFTISANLTFGGYSAYGLSYWLEANNALAPFINGTGVSYFTFPDGNGANSFPIAFNSTSGATSGFKSAANDFGATVAVVSPPNAVSPGSSPHHGSYLLY